MTARSAAQRAQIGVVGFGVIGKRVADAVRAQADMEVCGIGLRSRSPAAIAARRLDYRLYCTDEQRTAQLRDAGLPIAGGLEDLLRACHLVVDCTPRNQAVRRLEQYRSSRAAVILHGGERHDAVGFTFCSVANFAASIGRAAARIPSCNTTGLVRLLYALDRVWGVERAHAVIARCASDPDKPRKGIVNGAVVAPGLSHHGPDAQLLLPHISIRTQAITVPMTHGHVISLSMDLRRAADTADIANYLAGVPRIAVEINDRFTATCQLVGEAAARGRARGDHPELLVWGNSISAKDRVLCLQMWVHMESIVIPETIDCIRGLLSMQDTCSSAMRETDSALGIARRMHDYGMFDR